MIDGHGDDIWRYGSKVKHNFSTNIHSAFDHKKLMNVIAQSACSVTSYPEPEPRSVEEIIARNNNVSPDEVMVTNGATESIYLIARTASGCSSAIIVPTFREYQDACRMNGHSLSFINTLSQIPGDCQMVWLCNPNNPTGIVIYKDTLLKTAQKHRDKLFVIDQAYADYTLMQTLSAEEAVNAGNIILLGSLTKRFAVPGLRLGYSAGNASLIRRVKAWRMPWSVNGPAITGATFLLKNCDSYPIDTAGLHSEALRMAKELSRLGIKVWPTDCNFILCELPRDTAANLKQHLMEKAGILIRDASNFEGLGPQHFRVAAQTPEENNLLIKEIEQWITQ